jgi:monovalent cation:H+ antiporter, CPA1 family
LHLEADFVLLFVIATAVALGARRLGLPYTVALVLAGLVLGGFHLFPAPHLTRNLLFSVLLPALIFEAAFHISFREFRENWLTIFALAIPGVLASIALVTLVLTPIIDMLKLAPGFSWRDALVFGALISATDPVAVVALFRNLGAPRRLTLLLEAESLLNDGTAIVFFTLSLSVISGGDTTFGAVAGQFFYTVGAGAVVGSLIGAAVAALIGRVDDPMVEITLTTIAAYGSFITAETLNSSGVIAAVAAGMLCGNYAKTTQSLVARRVPLEAFWEWIVFALNSIVFLLIGFEVRFSSLLADWLPILTAYLIVTFGRAIVIAAGRAFAGAVGEPFPWRWTVVLTWGGLRGALPMVLALSLPDTFHYRELLISMTFGVAVLSILVQGLTMSGLLKRLL